jgi:hypothetical protein
VPCLLLPALLRKLLADMVFFLIEKPRVYHPWLFLFSMFCHLAWLYQRLQA